MEGKKGRVFVFDRVELALLVFFFVVVSVAAFVLGIRLGKKQALQHVGITEEHVRDVELKSDKEEYVEGVIDSAPSETPNEANGEADSKSIDEEAFLKLQDEFEKLDRKNFKAPEDDSSSEDESGDNDMTEGNPQDVEAPSNDGDESTSITTTTLDSLGVDSSILGKYTIQLGSYKTLEEAQAFAGGFIARGYRPLINEKDVNGQIWYRVSLGAFQSREAAKAYVESEKSLFSSQVEPFITKIE